MIEYANQHDEPVINADETAWYILPNNILTWAETSSKSVQINVQDSDKYHISLICGHYLQIFRYSHCNHRNQESEKSEVKGDAVNMGCPNSLIDLQLNTHTPTHS